MRLRSAAHARICEMKLSRLAMVDDDSPTNDNEMILRNHD